MTIACNMAPTIKYYLLYLKPCFNSSLHEELQVRHPLDLRPFWQLGTCWQSRIQDKLEIFHLRAIFKGRNTFSLGRERPPISESIAYSAQLGACGIFGTAATTNTVIPILADFTARLLIRSRS